MIQGIGVSNGIAMGTALLIDKKDYVIEELEIVNVNREIMRLNKAISKSKNQLEDIKKAALKNMSKENAQIFDAHIMLLEDPELKATVEKAIKEEKKNAEYILNRTIRAYIQIFETIDAPYMRERVADIKDVGNRIINNLLDKEDMKLNQVLHKVIVVAHDLLPSDIALIDKEQVLGFVTNLGGRVSHMAIMARNLGIPTVVGVSDITSKIKSGDFLIIDGATGEVLINPENKLIQNYVKKSKKNREDIKKFKYFKDKTTKTKDGKPVKLAANIGRPHDLNSVLNNGAEGIGLYRTEFLFMDRPSLPTEEEQFQAYKIVLENMQGRAVVIRTLDIGGDKEIPYLNLGKELNPSLGYRAIRICLDKIDIFKVQLKAIVRASIYGDLKIMYPMISSVEEVRLANKILLEVKEELKAEGIPYSENFEVGIMIEIPAAAMISDILAEEVDFFSIGTNDLIQYSAAIDRMNEKISYLYSPYHPGILRLIKMVIDNGHNEGIWVGMCGEAAGEPALIPLLLGFGIDELSMGASSILPIQKRISQITMQEAKEIMEKAMKFATANEVEMYLMSMLKQ
ncbi:phosphoenolpyruvate--protein phosphotransferase [Clostridiaceae bacterium 35-E11]